MNICACGCGKEIIIKPHHKYVGVPKFIKGHYNRGKHHTEEIKQKMSISHKGRKFTEEHKRKISESRKGNKYALGNKLSEEVRKKISKSNKGKRFSEEHKSKISKSHKGKKHLEETKRKMSEFLQALLKERYEYEYSQDQKIILDFTNEVEK